MTSSRLQVRRYNDRTGKARTGRPLAVCREKDEASMIRTISAPLEAIPDQILRHDRP